MLNLKLEVNDVSLLCSALFHHRQRERDRLAILDGKEFPIVERIMIRTIEKQSNLINRLDRLVNS